LSKAVKRGQPYPEPEFLSLVERKTDALVEETKTPKAMAVTIVEVEREDYARGGVLMADRK
jgi:phenylpyruvate tautomerase PptA (4-oxalocrotonate tautomerase family)